MTDEIVYPSFEQFSTPVDSGYVALVGHATYAFTSLEWNLTHVGHKLSPGFIVEVQKKTAHQIGIGFRKRLKAFTGNATLVAACDDAATEFLALVKRRNQLLHAHPATIRGQQRLHYWSLTSTLTWEPDDVVAFTHGVESLSRVLNALYYDPRMPV